MTVIEKTIHASDISKGPGPAFRAHRQVRAAPTGQHRYDGQQLPEQVVNLTGILRPALQSTPACATLARR